jgi:hypothetical protein
MRSAESQEHGHLQPLKSIVVQPHMEVQVQDLVNVQDFSGSVVAGDWAPAYPLSQSLYVNTDGALAWRQLL